MTNNALDVAQQGLPGPIKKLVIINFLSRFLQEFLMERAKMAVYLCRLGHILYFAHTKYRNYQGKKKARQTAGLKSSN